MGKCSLDGVNAKNLLQPVAEAPVFDREIALFTVRRPVFPLPAITETAPTKEQEPKVEVGSRFHARRTRRERDNRDIGN
jgi:hypothetical protein